MSIQIYFVPFSTFRTYCKKRNRDKCGIKRSSPWKTVKCGVDTCLFVRRVGFPKESIK